MYSTVRIRSWFAGREPELITGVRTSSKRLFPTGAIACQTSDHRAQRICFKLKGFKSLRPPSAPKACAFSISACDPQARHRRAQMGAFCSMLVFQLQMGMSRWLLKL